MHSSSSSSTTATATLSSSSPSSSSSSAYKKARRQHIRTTKNRPADVDAEWTPFRRAEKLYKRRFPPPDLSEVLDLAGDGHVEDENEWRGRRDAAPVHEITRDDGGGESKPARAFALPHIPGLVILPAFVSPDEQKRLVRWALRDHAKQPNETNLDTHYILPEKGLWSAHLEAKNHWEKEMLVQPKADTSASSSTQVSNDVPPPPNTVDDPGPRKLISNPPASQHTLPTLLTTPLHPTSPSPHLRSISPTILLAKLRWANVGWSYHWGSKNYDFTKGKVEVSDVVKGLVGRAVKGVDWRRVFGAEGQDGKAEGVGLSNAEWGEDDWRTWGESYEPDAGIVNFYQTNDTLMAHVDHSEICATSPLVSISLGNAAIFLIGGHTRDVPPTAILLRSGDVVIMAGPKCRRAYHGVPRILPNTLPSYFSSPPEEVAPNTGPDPDWPAYVEYMKNARININVRQVFPRGFEFGV